MWIKQWHIWDIDKEFNTIIVLENGGYKKIDYPKRAY